MFSERKAVMFSRFKRLISLIREFPCLARTVTDSQLTVIRNKRKLLFAVYKDTFVYLHLRHQVGSVQAVKKAKIRITVPITTRAMSIM